MRNANRKTIMLVYKQRLGDGAVSPRTSTIGAYDAAFISPAVRLRD